MENIYFQVSLPSASVTKGPRNLIGNLKETKVVGGCLSKNEWWLHTSKSITEIEDKQSDYEIESNHCHWNHIVWKRKRCLFYTYPHQLIIFVKVYSCK